jgi:hypothetical protein
MSLMNYKRRLARIERAIAPAIPEDREVVIHVVFDGGGPGYKIRYRHWGTPNATMEYIDDRTGKVSADAPRRVCFDDSQSTMARAID